MIDNIIYYTDGACSSNAKSKDIPSPGAYAVIGLRNNEKFIVHDHFEASTTSNRMELSAVLWVIENSYIENMLVLSDSQYVVNGFNVWLPNWKKKNWKTAHGKEVLNQDLWRSLDLVSIGKFFTLKWIRGHNNNFYNEEVDRLAKNKITNCR